VVRRVTKVEITFVYISEGCESGGTGRVVGNGGADSMLHFRLEKGRRYDEALPKDEAEPAGAP
jgi:hypothetical protein